MIKADTNIEKNKATTKAIIIALLCLLTLYPLFMRIDYTSIDFTIHSQIHWFIPLPIVYLVTIQLVLIIGLLVSAHKFMGFLPFITTYVLVSGFIVAQLPCTLQGDNLLHGANAKLIDIYGKVPPYSNTYAYRYPSLFILSSIFRSILGVEMITSNTLLVACLHIIITTALYAFLKGILDENDKVLAPLICAFNLLGNFHLTYFLSIFTPRLLSVPLFYLLLYTMLKNELKMKIIGILLLGAIITGHPIAPIYTALSVTGLITCINNQDHRPKLRPLLLILVPWIAWLIYKADYDFEWAVKIAFGQLEGPWHATYGISSSFIQEQLDFSKDALTTFLRAYRILIITFPCLIGGIAAGYYALQSTILGRKVPHSQKVSLSFAIFFMFVGSLVFYIISGRGHDYFYLFSYPILLCLAFSVMVTGTHFSKCKRVKAGNHGLLITVASIALVIMLLLSFLSIHSTRIYIGPSDYSGLTFLANLGPDKEISTTGDLYYDYAMFNPSYFWPGKVGRSLLIYASPQDLIEQSKKIPYVFGGEVVVRSSKQVFGLYFSGLSPSFWKSVDKHLAEQHNRIYDNGNMLLWFK
jgi:hypothetical protein